MLRRNSMEDIFNTFLANIPDQAIEVSDKSNIYQCMDLAYLWTMVLRFPKATIQHQYAYQVFANASDLTRQYFDIVANTPTGIPPKGALVVFDKTSTNIAGHISISNGVGTTNTFQSVDQNWAGVQKARMVTHNYDNPKVLGWLIPKLPNVIPPVVVEGSTKLDFQNMVTPVESYGILEFQLVKSKIIAKDQHIHELEQIPPAPVFTKPIAKLHYELAKEFEAATA